MAQVGALLKAALYSKESRNLYWKIRKGFWAFFSPEIQKKQIFCRFITIKKWEKQFAKYNFPKKSHRVKKTQRGAVKRTQTSKKSRRPVRKIEIFRKKVA